VPALELGGVLGPLCDGRPVGSQRDGGTGFALGLLGCLHPQRPVPRRVEQRRAAKVLASLLDKLRSASARGRRGHSALVRTMTEKGGA
jgi:hypothetical protein